MIAKAAHERHRVPARPIDPAMLTDLALQRGPLVRSGRRWALILAMFLILNVMGAFTIIDRTVYGDWDGKSGDKITQVLNLAQIFCSALLFKRGVSRDFTFGRGNMLLMALTGLLLLSTAWSIEPLTTVRRGVLYLLFMVGCIGVSRNMECDEFMDMTSVACCAAAAVSAALLVVSPGMVLTPDGDFRGVFSHKSVLGQIMLDGSIATLHGLRTGRRGPVTGGLMLALLVAVVYLCKSATSLMGVVVMCSASAIFTMLRRRGAVRIWALWLCALGAPLLLLGMMFQSSLLELLGKDPTLTGRTDLWAYVIGYIWQRPVLGWGLTAFWSGENPAANEISTILGWVVPQAHNGLLEILLEAGIVGACLFVAVLLRNMRIAVTCLSGPARELGVSALLCCLSIMLVGVTESVLIDPSLSAMMFFVLGMMCDRQTELSGGVRAAIPRSILGRRVTA